MRVSQSERIQWRKEQIQLLLARGHRNHREIAARLQIPKSTVSKDILALREDSKNNIRNYIDERLPEEYERILVGITAILKEAWDTSLQVDTDTREKMQALSLAKECYAMQLDLLTNPEVIEEASSFIAKYKNKNILKDEIEDISKDKKKESKNKEAERFDSNDSDVSITTNTNKVF
jgi:hypothetical protein